MTSPDESPPIRLSPEPRARLRVVLPPEPADVLPPDPDLFVGKVVTPTGAVLRGVGLAAVTIVVAWRFPAMARDATNHFGWWWDALWVVFPWAFLIPLWVLFVQSSRRKPELEEFRSRYRQRWDRTSPVVGVITDTRVIRDGEGARIDYVVTVTVPDGTVVVTDLAPLQRLADHELPRPTEPVHLWRFGDWTLIQAAAHRVGSGPAEPSRADDSDDPTSTVE